MALILVLILFDFLSTGNAFSPCNLKVESLKNPLSISTAQPRFSWQICLQPDEYNFIQDSFRILATSRGTTLWDSGKTVSNQTINIVYNGSPLNSTIGVNWTVQVWNTKGESAQDTEKAWFEIGLLQASDWKGIWIGRDLPSNLSACDYYQPNPNPLLRYEFSLKSGVKLSQARLYVTGLGYHHVYLDGQRIGNRELDPIQTVYSKRVFYTTYDVTSQLVSNQTHAIGIMLGNGFYNPLPLLLFGSINLRNYFGAGPPKAIVDLRLQYSDGSTQIVASSSDWKAGQGPILNNDLYLGVVHDARREDLINGWSNTGFNDSSWTSAVPLPAPAPILESQISPPVTIEPQGVPAVKVTAPDPTQPQVFVVDFGRNCAALISLTVKGKAGQKVVLRYGELIYPNGTLNVFTSVAGQIKWGNGGPCAPPIAWQTDTYILKGAAGGETFIPRFTWHGFRFAEVNASELGPGYILNKEDIVQLPLHSNLESASTFRSSNDLFNNIHQLFQNTLLSNVMGVQSDCPHRERFGYGGDLMASAETGIMTYDMSIFYSKRIVDFNDDVRSNAGFTECAPFNGIADAGMGGGSGPIDWGSVQPQLALWLYRYYGDRRLIEQSFNLSQAYVNFALTQPTAVRSGLGDWDPVIPTPVALTGVGILYADVISLVSMARILGLNDTATHWETVASQLQGEFNDEFLNYKTGVYDGDTQCGQAMPLYFGLVPDDQVTSVANQLINQVVINLYHLTVGMFGVKWMSMVLSDLDLNVLAYTIFNQTTYPGFGYMIVNNATTIWEEWAYDDYIYSHNHPMYGSVSQWFLQSLAGIRPDDDAAGFDKFTIAPRPVLDSLTNSAWIKASYNSARGPIYVTWNLIPTNVSSSISASPIVDQPFIPEISSKLKSNLPSLSPLPCPPNKLGGIVLEGQTLTLQCSKISDVITTIDFASYGTPTGECPNFTPGCQSSNSLTTIQKLCVGKNKCQIDASNTIFGGDPCPNVVKHLAVMVSGCLPLLPPQFVLDITTPANTKATVRIPSNPYFIDNVTVSPKLTGVAVEGGRAIEYEVIGGGSYHFTSFYSP